MTNSMQNIFGLVNRSIPAQNYSPQGVLGNTIGQIAEPVGGAIGHYFGAPQLGTDIGKAVSSVAHYIPYSASPQYAPQGVFGDIASSLAPVAGNVIGHFAGNQQLGSNIGNAIGTASSLLPFSATPQTQAAYAPQGVFGDIASSLAPVAGNVIGHFAGNQQLGSSIGNAIGTASSLLPFSATPQTQAAYAPQGVFGDIASSLAPVAGSAIGSFVAPGVGTVIGGSLGGAAGQMAKLLPFSATNMSAPSYQ